MKVFYSRYFKVNRLILQFVGAWPHMNYRCASLSRFCLSILFCIGGITMVSRLITSHFELGTVLEVSPYLVTYLAVAIKYYNNCYFNAPKMLKLIAIMEEDWERKWSTEEKRVFVENAEHARYYTNLYALSIYVFSSIYGLMTLVPPLLDELIPLNESRPHVYYYVGEYFVDQDEYFFYIIAQQIVCGVCGMSIVISVDMTFMLYVSHACGLLSISGVRISQALNYYQQWKTADHSAVDSAASPTKSPLFGYKDPKENSYDLLVFAIKSHQRTLRFIELLESAYSHSYFLQTGMSILVLSLTLAQIHGAIANSRIGETTRHFSFITGQLFHLFCMSYPGQLLSDHSTYLFQNAYCDCWYDVPFCTQRLLMLILRKSLFPTELTAGGLYTLLLENFAMVVQTSMSYFTVLASAA